jgi:hypothetical protein
MTAARPPSSTSSVKGLLFRLQSSNPGDPSKRSMDDDKLRQTWARGERRAEGRRVVVVWTEGNPEWGHRAMAQSFGVGHLPRSSPMAISPSEMDVIGAPYEATTNGRCAVVTLTASTEQGDRARRRPDRRALIEALLQRCPSVDERFCFSSA